MVKNCLILKGAGQQKVGKQWRGKGRYFRKRVRPRNIRRAPGRVVMSVSKKGERAKVRAQLGKKTFHASRTDWSEASQFGIAKEKIGSTSRRRFQRPERKGTKGNESCQRRPGPQGKEPQTVFRGYHHRQKEEEKLGERWPGS